MSVLEARIRQPDQFDSEIVPMLKASPRLRAVAVFEEIVRRHPELRAGIRRTVERRVRSWPIHGEEQEVIFAKSMSPAACR